MRLMIIIIYRYVDVRVGQNTNKLIETVSKTWNAAFSWHPLGPYEHQAA